MSVSDLLSSGLQWLNSKNTLVRKSKRNYWLKVRGTKIGFQKVRGTWPPILSGIMPLRIKINLDCLQGNNWHKFHFLPEHHHQKHHKRDKGKQMCRWNTRLVTTDMWPQHNSGCIIGHSLGLSPSPEKEEGIKPWQKQRQNVWGASRNLPQEKYKKALWCGDVKYGRLEF